MYDFTTGMIDSGLFINFAAQNHCSEYLLKTKRFWGDENNNYFYKKINLYLFSEYKNNIKRFIRRIIYSDICSKKNHPVYWNK